MLTTSDEKVADRLRHLRQHAMTTSDLARHKSQTVMTESYDEVGYNYRMTDVQAALGLVQLSRVDGFIARRRSLAARYSEELTRIGWLIPPHEPSNCRHNFQSYMARLSLDAPVSRDTLMQGLLDRSISTRRGIMASHREEPYRDPKWDGKLPQTNAATDESIILPLFHQMTDEQQSYVIECIGEIGSAASA
jgi:dTDP-4-amino-4,6-dideoxygalactose transaminase